MTLIIWILIVSVVIGALCIKANKEERLMYLIVGLISVLILMRNLNSQ